MFEFGMYFFLEIRGMISYSNNLIHTMEGSERIAWLFTTSR